MDDAYNIEEVLEEKHVDNIFFEINEMVDTTRRRFNILTGYGSDGSFTLFKCTNDVGDEIYIEFDNDIMRIGKTLV